MSLNSVGKIEALNEIKFCLAQSVGEGDYISWLGGVQMIEGKYFSGSGMSKHIEWLLKGDLKERIKGPAAENVSFSSRVDMAKGFLLHYQIQLESELELKL